MQWFWFVSAAASTDGTSDTCDKFKDTSTISDADSDDLSDIDDVEVCGLHIYKLFSLTNAS